MKTKQKQLTPIQKVLAQLLNNKCQTCGNTIIGHYDYCSDDCERNKLD